MKTAVLLMAYGAAGGPEDVPAYLQDIRGGRPAGPELIAEVRERYRLMGGCSPLLDIARRQAAALEARVRCPVLIGMRHSPPTILEAVRDIQRKGCGRVAAMPLTPYYSKLSVGAYMTKYEEAVRTAGARFTTVAIESWNDHPLFVRACAAKLREALEKFGAGDVSVIFSAHSLPERILQDQDPYPTELAETVKAVAAEAGLESWDFAYQSRGRTPEPWLGPDVAEVIDRLAAQGRKNVLVAPIGFICDHMETLYDDDILYRNQAEALGLRFARVPALNADPLLIDAMADVVLAHLKAAA